MLVRSQRHHLASTTTVRHHHLTVASTQWTLKSVNSGRRAEPGTKTKWWERARWWCARAPKLRAPGTGSVVFWAVCTLSLVSVCMLAGCPSVNAAHCLPVLLQDTYLFPIHSIYDDDETFVERVRGSIDWCAGNVPFEIERTTLFTRSISLNNLSQPFPLIVDHIRQLLQAGSLLLHSTEGQSSKCHE